MSEDTSSSNPSLNSSSNHGTNQASLLNSEPLRRVGSSPFSKGPVASVHQLQTSFNRNLVVGATSGLQARKSQTSTSSQVSENVSENGSNLDIQFPFTSSSQELFPETQVTNSNFSSSIIVQQGEMDTSTNQNGTSYQDPSPFQNYSTNPPSHSLTNDMVTVGREPLLHNPQSFGLSDMGGGSSHQVQNHYSPLFPNSSTTRNDSAFPKVTNGDYTSHSMPLFPPPPPQQQLIDTSFPSFPHRSQSAPPPNTPELSTTVSSGSSGPTSTAGVSIQKCFNQHAIGTAIDYPQYLDNSRTTSSRVNQQIPLSPNVILPPGATRPVLPTSSSGTSNTINTREKSIAEYVEEFLSRSSSALLDLSHLVEGTLEYLQELCKHSQWTRAAECAQKMLGTIDQQNNKGSWLQVKEVYMCALLLQNRFEDLSTEFTALGDFNQPMYCSESNDTQEEPKYLMPMRIRLIYAIIPQKIGNNMSLSQDRLNELLSDIQEYNKYHLDSEELEKWTEVVSCALINSMIADKKYEVALRLCASLEKEDNASKIVLGSRIGRIYLQMGNLQAAEKIFKVVEEIVSGKPEEFPRVLFNRGLLQFAKSEYVNALNHFAAVLEMEKNTTKVDLLIDEDADLLTCAANNLSICALYCCDVKRAVQCLEDMIKKNPRRHLQKVLVFNLCTLYDLACDNTGSNRRKRVLLHVSEKYGLGHLGTSPFRI